MRTSSYQLPSLARSEKPALILAAVLIVCLVLVIYFPALSSGLWADEYIFLERAGRAVSITQYMLQSFNPRIESSSSIRRPVIGALFWIEYNLFRDNGAGYHLVNLAIHAANCLMLTWLVFNATRRSRLALLSGLSYAILPIKAFAVIWISNITELASGFFSLLAVCFWLNFLRGARKFYVPTLFACMGALLSKENAITLPVTLFLFDRLIVRSESNMIQLARRYALFAIVLIAYLNLYSGEVHYLVLDQAPMAVVMSVRNLARYLALLMFPWESEYVLDNPAVWGWGIFVLLAFLYLVWKTSSRQLVFLGMEALVTLVAYLPIGVFHASYLYLPTMISAILLAALFDWAFGKQGSRVAVRILAAVSVAILILYSNSTIASTAASLRELSRVDRIPFRVISQQHRSFQRGTFLYFVDPPTPTDQLSSMFFLRYGNDVEVGSTEKPTMARFGEHQSSRVYYFEERSPVEIVVTENRVETSPALPLNFGKIRLEGLEVTCTTCKRGEPFVLLLYWTTAEIVSKDYTVFVHLLNEKAEMVHGQDSPPGRAPTSAWKPGRLVADAHLLTVPLDVPNGQYHIEIGLYDLSTLERLEIVGANGRTVTDKVVVRSFVLE